MKKLKNLQNINALSKEELKSISGGINDPGGCYGPLTCVGSMCFCGSGASTMGQLNGKCCEGFSCSYSSNDPTLGICTLG